MVLDECGLINSSGTLSLNVKLKKDQQEPAYTLERVALLSSTTDEETKISFGIHTLTRAGKELFSIVDARPNNDYFIDFAKQIEAANKGKVTISVHSVNEINDGIINYNQEPLAVLQSNT